MSDEPRDFLAAILSFFGIGLGTSAAGTGEPSYHQRDDFLSAAELSFYGVVVSAVRGRAGDRVPEGQRGRRFLRRAPRREPRPPEQDRPQAR